MRVSVLFYIYIYIYIYIDMYIDTYIYIYIYMNTFKSIIWESSQIENQRKLSCKEYYIKVERIMNITYQIK